MADMAYDECKRLAMKAGVLRGDEVLSSDVHGPEPPPPSWNDDYGSDYDYGWEPKISKYSPTYATRNATGRFQCCGWGTGSGSGGEEGYRHPAHARRHVSSVPCTVVVKTYKEECLTPFSCKVDTVVEIRCEECHLQEKKLRDEELEQLARERKQLAREEEEQREAYKAEMRLSRKRKREEKRERETKRLREAAAADPEIATAQAKLAKLKRPRLKSLCAANFLMTSGVKGQLVERLAMCHKHGGAGKCPKCGRSKLEVMYEGLDPKAVQCKHRYSNGRQCRFGSITLTDDNRAELLPHKLRDDAENSLASVDVEV